MARSNGSRGLGSLIITGMLVVVGVLFVGGLSWKMLSPFSTTTKDRTAPPVLTRLRDLSEFHAASGDFEVLVDIEKDVKYLPSFIAGERVFFVGIGSVDAYVDFADLDDGSIVVSDDGSSVRVVLPAAQLGEPNLDTEQSHVANRDRGLLDRVGGMFVDNPTSEHELYVLAEDKLASAAEASELRQRAEDNTAQMLTNMLQAMGFDDVKVDFGPDAATGVRADT
jgi:hypothetical protein